ncbi:MAG: hypothetical protein RI957_2159 [Verrucomicrobiota bacterium]|jgi:hypothetical protein
MILKRFSPIALLGAMAVAVSSLHSQSADTPIADQSIAGIKKADAAIIEKAKKLIAEKKLLSRTEVKKQLQQPQPKPVELIAVQTKSMALEDVSATARKANFRVGFCYLCPRCDHWHLNMAGGYPIAKDVVATCDHVVDSQVEMREGYLIVADHEGHVHPVTSVLARSIAMDAAILHCAGAEFAPLALNGSARQGAAAFCYSTPMSQQGYFSDGIINRFFWNQKYEGGDKEKLDVARHLRVNFSTDWAPGSSGSAVLDQCGNVLGHVSQISSLSKDRSSSAYVTLHTGVPAHGVKLLAEACRNPQEISRLCSLEVKENPVKKNDTKEKDAASEKKK